MMVTHFWDREGNGERKRRRDEATRRGDKYRRLTSEMFIVQDISSVYSLFSRGFKQVYMQ